MKKRKKIKRRGKSNGLQVDDFTLDYTDDR